VIDALVQHARTYIYSTALPPMAPAVAMAAIGLLQQDESLVAALRDRIAAFKAACQAKGIALEPSSTAIQPLIVGGAERALAVSAALRDEGFLVPAIRPPTVPDGTSRLRISISAAHATSDVERLAGALARALA
jgi:8-amino-7-oxononanoate synthase